MKYIPDAFMLSNSALNVSLSGIGVVNERPSI